MSGDTPLNLDLLLDPLVRPEICPDRPTIFWGALQFLFNEIFTKAHPLVGTDPGWGHGVESLAVQSAGGKVSLRQISSLWVKWYGCLYQTNKYIHTLTVTLLYSLSFELSLKRNI